MFFKHLLPVFLIVAAQGYCYAEDALPRVLILGDVIYQQPTAEINKLLKGSVDVVFAKIQPGEIRNSKTILEEFDGLIGDGNWDVIHFNIGLGDLVYCAPEMNDFRLLPKRVGGVRATSADQYRTNLEELVKKLKSTNAKLIWASTTPIRHSTTGVFEPGSEIEYNAIAATIMQENNIAINDMHSYIKGLIDMNKPAAHGADPFHFDRKPIHGPILDVIKSSLGLK